MGHFSSANVLCRPHEGRYLLSLLLSPLCMRTTRRKRALDTVLESLRVNVKDFLDSKAPQGTGHIPAQPAAIRVTQELDIGVRNSWLLHWIIYTLSLVQKRIGSSIKGSLSHGRKTCGPRVSTFFQTCIKHEQSVTCFLLSQMKYRTSIQWFKHRDYNICPYLTKSLKSRNMPSHIQKYIVSALKVFRRANGRCL
jgi:hypothetical protein